MNNNSNIYDKLLISLNAISILDNMKIPNNAAIIFDIDDTLLYSHNKNPINSIIMLYNYSKMKGITPYIITYRQKTPNNINYTINELNKIGVSGYNQLYLAPPNIDPWTYKINIRKHITEKNGMNIIMSVGDSDWDISGGYHGIGIKV
jgi:hypothetical protein